MELALLIACYIGIGIILCAGIECSSDWEFDGRACPPLIFAVLLWPLVAVIFVLLNLNKFLRKMVNSLVRLCEKAKTAIKTRIQED